MLPLSKGKSLFTVRHLMLLGVMALLLGTSLAFTAVASAKTASPTRAAATWHCGGTCDGKNPVQYGCSADATDHYPNYNASYAEHIVIRYSSACGAAWAKVWFDYTLSANNYGNAIVTRTSDNRQFDCVTGNGIVLPGQSSCYSGMLNDDSTTAWGAGMYNISNTGWFEVVRTTAAY